MLLQLKKKIKEYIKIIIIRFFKNNFSWHSVNEINPQNKLERKVLNIFIRVV